MTPPDTKAADAEAVRAEIARNTRWRDEWLRSFLSFTRRADELQREADAVRAQAKNALSVAERCQSAADRCAATLSTDEADHERR